MTSQSRGRSLQRPGDDGEGEEEAQPSSPTSPRRHSSKACDHCRKTKTRCIRIPPNTDRCKACTTAGIACTFEDPTSKRGPPKNYINAIERRWQQVESILGAIIACADGRAQGMLEDLKKDDLAKEIIERVDRGPYGPSGRLQQPAVASKEDFFVSILKSANVSQGGSSAAEVGGPRRQSRLSREYVSSGEGTDALTLASPTTEWQDRLITLLDPSAKEPPSSLAHSAGMVSSSSVSTLSDPSGAPLSQRRRLTGSSGAASQQDWGQMYTVESSMGTLSIENPAETLDAEGQLSLDEHREVRFHGKASGMQLLPRTGRADDRNRRGVWRLPMARVWPLAHHRAEHYQGEDDLQVEMPPLHVQDSLVELYFIYVHPHFPVLHKTHFLLEYQRRNYSVSGSDEATQAPASTPGSESPQSVSKLLLLCMFSITARYLEDPSTPVQRGQMWEAGCNYLNGARHIMSQIYHQSRASTCQALLILGHREFGLGSAEQGWMFTGMAIRMAYDLGLNRNADEWKFNNGPDIFSSEAKQSRKQIWWICCAMDKFASVHMGRPQSICQDDYDTPMPTILQEDDEEIWKPVPSKMPQFYHSSPSLRSSCFNAACALSVIVGSITALIYPVKAIAHSTVESRREEMEQHLDKWRINLDTGLQYDPSGQSQPPPPHVLLLHVQYWAAVLLLERAFVPNWTKETFTERDPETSLAFDRSQSAANHISTIATTYRHVFGVKSCPPSLSAYLFSAGIMHVMGTTLRPTDPQGALGLQQCLDTLKEMEIVWPSAERAWDLLNGSKSWLGTPWSAFSQGGDKGKRRAVEAFADPSGAYGGEGETSGAGALDSSPAMHEGVGGVQGASSLIMAGMLGLDIPGYAPRETYASPAHDFWAQSIAQNQAQQRRQQPAWAQQEQTTQALDPRGGALSQPSVPVHPHHTQQQTPSAEWIAYTPGDAPEDADESD